MTAGKSKEMRLLEQQEAQNVIKELQYGGQTWEEEMNWSDSKMPRYFATVFLSN